MDQVTLPLPTMILQITQLRIIAATTGTTIPHGMILRILTGTILLRIVKLTPEIIIATIILDTTPQHGAPTDPAGESYTLDTHFETCYRIQ